MKISGLTTRLLSIDTAPRYRGGVVPAGLPSTWYFPIVTIHTDAGVDGYSMAYGPHSDGKTCAALLHDSYYPQIDGADPTQIEALWQKLFSRQRHLYVNGRPRTHYEGKRGSDRVTLWNRLQRK